jgi:hypothetical protein
MYLVAIKASQSAMVHVALYEIVPLHAVFVCSPIWEEVEVLSAKFCLFEMPETGETVTG